ncbi:MAG: fungal specific transcription factor domain-containing protein, partial [Terriglobus roseus]|nr:fungal specific transcription factor domain-containing protein [Terriglobus roseus]
QFEDELDDQPFALSQKLRLEPTQVVSNGSSWDTGSQSDAFIEREIRRRTFWSIFVMDRYVSSGKYRPHTIHAQDVHIQLPSSERAFLFGEKVRTLKLGEEEHPTGRSEVETPRRYTDFAHTNGEQHWSPSIARESPRVKDEDRDSELGRWEVGTDEGLTSRFVKALELFGKLVKWACAGGRR